MRDTIYRDDAIRVASGYCHPANIAKELAKLPSAQPERKTGRWIEIKHTFFHKCSECSWLNDVDSGYSFCPNCGAKMEGTKCE